MSPKIKSEPSPSRETVARFVRLDPSKLQSLQSLPDACIIVLFTPALPALTTGKKEHGSAQDPFECLGRAIERRHARVRHVPYVPGVGFTSFHLPFVRQAHAFITVIAEPPIRPGSKEYNDSIKGQETFATTMSDTLRMARPKDCKDVTMTLIRCGTNSTSQHTGYQNMVQCPSYAAVNLDSVAGILMK